MIIYQFALAFFVLFAGFTCYGSAIATAPKEGWVVTLIVGSICLALGFVNLGIAIAERIDK